MSRLVIAGLKHSFGSPVLRGVELTIAPGETLGLVGENGAGKSTIVNILNGLFAPDGGTVQLNGVDHRPASPREARAAGVTVASQELSLIDTLTVAENVMLGALPARYGLIARGPLAERASATLAEVGLDHIPLDVSPAALSLAERQLLEFAKAIALPSRLLILDEPTAALTGTQAEIVHKVLAKRAASGTAIIYISHRLQDVLRVCDRIAVLRDGAVVSTAPTEAFDVDKLIQAMSGRSDAFRAEHTRAVRSSGPLLSARALKTIDFDEPIDLDVHGGEILGIAGLAGSGRTELLDALFGVKVPISGSVTRSDGDQRVAVRSPAEAVRAKIGYLTEDRRRSGIFAGRSIDFNAAVASLAKFSRRGMVAERSIAARVRQLASDLDVRTAGGDADVARLSGGNQQKILFARWLMRGVDVLLLDEPTRGVDVSAKFEIHRQIRALAAQGCAIVLVSSELEEVMALADRILVLSAGTVVGTFEPAPFDANAILAAAFQGHLTSRHGASAKKGLA